MNTAHLLKRAVLLSDSPDFEHLHDDLRSDDVLRCAFLQTIDKVFSAASGSACEAWQSFS